MKTSDDLKNFYDTLLYNDLKSLEAYRKNVVSRLVAALVIIAVLAAIICFLLRRVEFVLFVLAAGFAAYTAVYYFCTKEYRSKFKSSIIEKIVKFTDPGLSYEKDNYLHEPQFVTSSLFLKTPDRYHGDDYVFGVIGKTRIEFSEIHAEYKTETRDSQGRRHTRWNTIFKGIFFRADFNKNFQGRTVVLPDTAERLFGNLGTSLQSWNIARGQLIKLEDPDFEKVFVVYGDDQIESRYILSTSLMKRIREFKEKTGKNICVSFTGSSVFVAIPYSQDMFEPRIFKTLLDFSPILNYFENLELVAGIVDDFNLNIRIWDKQA